MASRRLPPGLAGPSSIGPPDLPPATMKAALARPEPRVAPARRPGRAVSSPPPHQMLRRVEPASVFRLSLAVYLSLVVVVAMVAAVLWLIAVGTGAIHGVNHFIEQLFGYQSFSLNLAQLLIGILLIGAALAVIGSFVNLALVVIYNATSERLGGLRLVLREETGRRRGVASRSRRGL